MTSASLTRELTVPGSGRVPSPLTGVSTPAGTSTLKTEVRRRKRSLTRRVAQPGSSTDAAPRFRQPSASHRRPRCARAGAADPRPFPVHPHMLRHATGYKLANDGPDTRAIQHYLGHRNIVHTTRYTNLAPDRFRAFWRD